MLCGQKHQNYEFHRFHKIHCTIVFSFHRSILLVSHELFQQKLEELKGKMEVSVYHQHSLKDTDIVFCNQAKNRT